MKRIKMKKSILKALLMVLLLGGTVSSSYAVKTKLTIELKGYKSNMLQLFNNDYGKYANIISNKFDLNQTNGIASIDIDLDKPVFVGVHNYFNVFLAPGDDLQIKADVTNLYGGLKISYQGKGKENNEYLHNAMNIYYQYFQVPFYQVYKQKLNSREIAGKFEAVTSGIKSIMEKNKNSMHLSLYKYLYTYTELILPSIVVSSIRSNTYDQDVDILYKYQPDLGSIKLYREGYFDLNFLNYIRDGFKKFLRIDGTKKTDAELDKNIDSYYVKLEGLTDDMEVRTGMLYTFVDYLSNPDSNLFSDKITKMYPYIQRYSKAYPGPRAEGLNRWYEAKQTLAPGKVPPSIDLVDLNGNEFSFEAHKGKVVYIDFWASWCGPCRGEMKKGAPALHEKFKNEEVVFVYISIDSKHTDWIKAIKEDKIEGLHLNDPNEQVAKIYNITAVPRYMLIGKDGKIIDGEAPRPTNPKAAEMISKALSE